ncbi:hypothetical protein MIMGU_mgv11b022267mg [Erythranthe guttata]|uniref:Cytochrome P450 n=1 Tax=Erythranthe guttata TaxID=4155 RepID=A0A022QUB1_ERYGU|nr:hypothetical protein MIMGU_mgv11b022267mg [Erythranthe guttata]
MWYDYTDLAFSPYNEYRRQMRRICVVELLSAKNVKSFGSIRQDEVSILIKSIKTLLMFLSGCRQMGSSSFPSLTTTSKLSSLCMQDMFSAGKETSSSAIDWAMAELMRNPRVMEKVQREVRECLKGKEKDIDVKGLKYLKLVVKETLRLHPPIPVMISVWAMGMDPETFQPERFENSCIDFLGSSFEYLPFGAGRRICPGVNFGLASVELSLAQILYHFDWSLPPGISFPDVDLTEQEGITVSRKNHLFLLPTLYINPSH